MSARQPRLLSFLMVSLGTFAALKTAGIVIGLTAAQAQTEPSPADLLPISATSAQEAEPIETATPQTVAPPLAPTGETERRILERLALRRAELDAREADLAAREAVLRAAEAKLARGLDAFASERAEIEAMREERDAASSADIEALVSAYERMKPRNAATIFNELDDDIMLAVAGKMRTQALAGVLAEMAPDKARSLTMLLAERSLKSEAPAQEVGAP